jgi:predicted DsbA family dithiol-disulfide isomerase
MSGIDDDDVPHPVLHWYDFVCPFCYIGQSRTAILTEAGLEVISLPFRAHPDIPAGGILVGPRRGPRYKMIEREAAAAGLALHWPARIPNSSKPLAAAEWVRRNQLDAFAELHHKLFEAHFALGEDIANQAVIDRHAATAGVDLGGLHTALADGSAYAQVDQAERAGQQYGVYGTPAWLLGARLVAGLLPASEFQRVARDALGQRARSERTKR